LRDYEILYIVRPDLDEEKLTEAVGKVTALIETLGGQHERTNVWGKRRLAYEVDHLREGFYVLTDFQIEPGRVPEMESTLKISDSVFRHLIVRRPERKKAADGQRPQAAEQTPAVTAEPPEAVVTAEQAPTATVEPPAAAVTTEQTPAAIVEPPAAAVTTEDEVEEVQGDVEP